MGLLGWGAGETVEQKDGTPLRQLEVAVKGKALTLDPSVSP